MIFTIYERATGRIEKVVSCPNAKPERQYNEATHFHIEGSYDDDAYYISGGAPVKMPPRPSAFHAFDFAKKSWVCNTDAAWASVRRERNRKLASSDWVTTPDVQASMSDALRSKWLAYRQALRDITTQADPLRITWPDAPT